MRKQLEEKLYHDYPKIFRQKDLPMSQTAMCWGLNCSDGWYWLINNLCFQLQFDIDKNHYPQIEFTQVKEKFGLLRIYYTYAEDAYVKRTEKQQNDIQKITAAQDGMIDFAMSLSESICEECGSTDRVTQTAGWVYTRCHKCLSRMYREKFWCNVKRFFKWR